MKYLGLQEYNPISWSDVAKKITDEIASGHEKVQKAKKDTADLVADAEAEQTKYDQTKVQSINQVLFSVGQNARGKVTEAYDMVKRGEMSITELKRMISGMSVSVGAYKKQLSSVAQEYEALVNREDIANSAELLTREKLLNQVTNPTNIPTFDDLGNMLLIDERTGDTIPVNLDFYQKDKYDPIKEVDNVTKGLADVARVENGRYVITEGGRAKYEDLKNTSVDIAVKDDQNVVDILTRYPQLGGMQLEVVTNPTEEDMKDKSKVIMVWDGQKYIPDTNAPNWKEQKEEAKKKMDVLFDSRVVYKQKDETMTDFQRGQLYAKDKESRRKAAAEASEKLAPISTRARTIVSLTDKGTSSEYAGQIKGSPLPYAEQRMEETGDQAFEGFTIDSWKRDPSDKGKVIVTLKKGKAGATKEDLKIKKISMSVSDFEVNTNRILNQIEKTPGSRILETTDIQDAIRGIRQRGGLKKGDIR